MSNPLAHFDQQQARYTKLIADTRALYALYDERPHWSAKEKAITDGDGAFLLKYERQARSEKERLDEIHTSRSTLIRSFLTDIRNSLKNAGATVDELTDIFSLLQNVVSEYRYRLGEDGERS